MRNLQVGQRVRLKESLYMYKHNTVPAGSEATISNITKTEGMTFFYVMFDSCTGFECIPHSLYAWRFQIKGRGK